MERSILTQAAILRITSVIALGLSSLLPLASILVLNTVQKVPVRLGIIAAFTVVFSLTLGLVTGARRVEIFSAAAAYVLTLLSWHSTCSSNIRQIRSCAGRLHCGERFQRQVSIRRSRHVRSPDYQQTSSFASLFCIPTRPTSSKSSATCTTKLYRPAPRRSLQSSWSSFCPFFRYLVISASSPGPL
jgi:hypothetical protein